MAKLNFVIHKNFEVGNLNSKIQTQPFEPRIAASLQSVSLFFFSRYIVILLFMSQNLM